MLFCRARLLNTLARLPSLHLFLRLLLLESQSRYDLLWFLSHFPPHAQQNHLFSVTAMDVILLLLFFQPLFHSPCKNHLYLFTSY
ncbi:hypothetical protein DSY3946 [Desulfitobacterium hafniense Y51]|uniref:Uncharacterized protein n=1 Tax=Desulfitobacterium hafniense (strain Y51) TaxID=138119 RepID=Q24QF7_DESHY|nr:hypothetical protein DSY3946 [Desulfitobacterium hafniense Y51]